MERPVSIESVEPQRRVADRRLVGVDASRRYIITLASERVKVYA